MTDDEERAKQATLDSAMRGLKSRLATFKGGGVAKADQRKAALGLLLFHFAMLSRETASTVRGPQLIGLAGTFSTLWQERRADIVQMIPVVRETDPDLH